MFFVPVDEEGRMPPWRAVAMLLPVLSAACSPSPETVTRLVYPTLPPTLCARAPAPPALDASDKAWAIYKQARDAAGDDCRDKLNAVDAVVKSWAPP
jgi:hypothetical protein